MIVIVLIRQINKGCLQRRGIFGNFFWPPAKKCFTYLIYNDMKQRNSSHSRSYIDKCLAFLLDKCLIYINIKNAFHYFHFRSRSHHTIHKPCCVNVQIQKPNTDYQYPLTPSQQQVTSFLPLKQTELFKSWNQCTSPEILVHAISIRHEVPTDFPAYINVQYWHILQHIYSAKIPFSLIPEVLYRAELCYQSLEATNITVISPEPSGDDAGFLEVSNWIKGILQQWAMHLDCNNV